MTVILRSFCLKRDRQNMGEMNCYYLHFINEGCRKTGLISVRKTEKELEIELEFPHCPKLIHHLFNITDQITIPKTHFLENSTFSITD